VKHQYLKQKAATEQKLKDEALAYKAVLDAASKEERDLTDDDRTEIAEHMKNIEVLEKQLAEVEQNIKTLEDVDAISKNMGAEFTNFGREVEVVEKKAEEIIDLGEQFIESKGYKELMSKGLSGEFSSGPIELDEKATLWSTPGTALTPSQYVPGIVETLYQRLYADLFAQVQVNTNQIQYVSETTATNAAAAVAEGQAKPESTLVFGESTEPIRKIATILPVADEVLEDAPQIRAYINQRLILFVKQEEEEQLLLGVGTGANLTGLLKRPTGGGAIGTYARGTVDDNALAIFKAMNGARGSSQLEPDAIVIHPTNWQAIRTAKDSSGQYYGGGPFYGPYGGPQGPAGASQFSVDSIWGTRVVVTSAVTIGTAVTGSFQQGAALYRRSGVTVEATNSHSTWFADNLTALRAEERLGLAVYRPSAFVAVTGLS
jgi:HK97 family phage major capsid protein